jgi:hypothetical protein
MALCGKAAAMVLLSSAANARHGRYVPRLSLFRQFEVR